MFSPENIAGPLQAALEVAALALRVHPLIGKHAILDDWPARATADHAEVLRLIHGNYGIVCDQVAVIDTDTEELSSWWAINMPKTPWTVNTPHGGRHFFYRSVPGLKNAVKAHRGWDVRAGGRSYVVGFGSVVDGKEYELLGEATLDLPPFDPGWLPEKSISLPKIAVTKPRGKIRDLSAYIRRIMSIQGQRGSDACFRVACILRDEGLTPEEAFVYMEEWNEKCAIPPWSVEERKKKIRDAFLQAMRRLT